MKIAINWSFSSWKTTLVKKFWWNRIISPERIVAKEVWFDFNNHTSKQLEEYQKLVLQKVIELEKKYWDDLVTDTSLHIVYAYSQGTRHLVWEALNKQTYDLVFHCEPLPIENDWIRNTNKDFQKEIDEKIHSLYDMLGVEPILLIWDIKTRFNLIKKHIW